MSTFKQTMSALGYEFEEQVGSKLSYRKRARFSELVLIIDLELKYINPILVPVSPILFKRDIVEILDEFNTMRENAQLIADMSRNQYQVLNQERTLK